jgi:ABC-type uncharacterized transport system YnjBCD ATPase subunit
MALLSLREIRKEYSGSRVVLKGVNLDVGANDFVVIRGRSGNGKSTLLRIMGLLDSPTSGEVLVDGRETSKMKDPELSKIRLTTFGFVFQQFNLIPSLNNVENVELPMQLAGRLGADERRKRALALLQSFDVESLAKRFPGEVSGGCTRIERVGRYTSRQAGVCRVPLRPCLLTPPQVSENRSIDRIRITTRVFVGNLRKRACGLESVDNERIIDQFVLGVDVRQVGESFLEGRRIPARQNHDITILPDELDSPR